MDLVQWLQALFGATVRLYIYLPQEYNPDTAHPYRSRQPIPAELRDSVITELEDYFGERFRGLTSEVVIKWHVTGQWRGYEDENRIIYMDIQLSLKDLRWLRKIRDTVWQPSFEQEAIYVAYHKVNAP